MEKKLVTFKGSAGMVDYYHVDISLMAKKIKDIAPLTGLSMTEAELLNYVKASIPAGETTHVYEAFTRWDFVLNELKTAVHENFTLYINNFQNRSPDERIEYYQQESAAIKKALAICKVTGVLELESEGGNIKGQPGPKVEKTLEAVRDVLLGLIGEMKIEEDDDSSKDQLIETSIKKMAWLHELGILNLIDEITKNEGKSNPSKASKLISSFTDINLSAIKTTFQAIITPNKNNTKNHPSTNEENSIYIANKKLKYKLK
jgi:hypothetical protein